MLKNMRESYNNFLKNVIPEILVCFWHKMKLSLLDGYAVKSYSQEGEDMILRRLFEHTTDGFYVAVGAYHPKRFSNTYYFYKRGWSGMNIDATPGSMQAFQKARPRDINIEAAIAKDRRELTFYMFNDPALNSFDEALSRKRVREGYRVVKEQKIVTSRLEDILADNMPTGQNIDFMSVDVEGFDLEVLQSNDWQLFRPTFLLVESRESNLEDIRRSEVYKFLNVRGYVLFARTANTIIFKDKEAYD